MVGMISSFENSNSPFLSTADLDFNAFLRPFKIHLAPGIDLLSVSKQNADWWFGGTPTYLDFGHSLDILAPADHCSGK